MRHYSLLAFVLLGSTLGACAVKTTGMGPGGGGSTGTPGAAGTTGSAGTSGGPAGRGGVTGTGGGGNQVGAGGNGGGAMDVDAGNCGLQHFQINLDPPEILVVLDRSVTMGRNLADETAAAGEPTKWSQVIPALTAVIQSSRPDMSWGVKMFPQDGGECVNASLTSLIDIPVAAGTHAAVVSKIMMQTPVGDGTPTGAAIAVAADHLRSLTSTRRKFILLATDGQPSCVGRVGSISYMSGAPARDDSIAAVSAAAQAGYHVFVVGVATTKTNDRATLNQLAIAGLEPSSDTRPGADRFYLGSTQQELQRAFANVADAASACIFPLNTAPPIPDKIGVYVGSGMAKAPRDANKTEGWEYTDATQRTVQVFGAWCDMIKTQGANTVQIIYGCPLIDVP